MVFSWFNFSVTSEDRRFMPMVAFMSVSTSLPSIWLVIAPAWTAIAIFADSAVLAVSAFKAVSADFALSALKAYGTDAKGRSGLNCWNPLTPSLNHTRNFASVCWAKIAGSIAPMPCWAVLPRRMEYKPPFTGTATEAWGSAPSTLVPSLLQ